MFNLACPPLLNVAKMKCNTLRICWRFNYLNVLVGFNGHLLSLEEPIFNSALHHLLKSLAKLIFVI